MNSNPILALRRSLRTISSLLLLIWLESVGLAQAPLAIPGIVSGQIESDQWQYYQLTIPAGSPGFRLAISHTGSTPRIYFRRGALPTDLGGEYDRQIDASADINTEIFTDTDLAADTYYIGVHLPLGYDPSQFTLTTELGWYQSLSWDSGSTPAGDLPYVNASSTGGQYWFRFNVGASAVGAWRAALDVTGGEAELELREGAVQGASLRSNQTGSDGFVVSSERYDIGRELWLVVTAQPGSTWSLKVGDVFVNSLGELSTTPGSGATVTVGAEGTAFFKTTIPSTTLAWRLWLNGANQELLVRKGLVPLSSGRWDFRQNRQMLVVPDSQGNSPVNGAYFVSVAADPGSSVHLESMQQPVAALEFGADQAIHIGSGEFPYRTYRVTVPIQQIAWELTFRGTHGDGNVAVRRENVANEFTNDGMSDLVGTVADSLTLVPPTLSDGTYYITVYGSEGFDGTLQNRPPRITDVDYQFQITNDDPDRAGLRVYRVFNVQKQLGTLGWELLLSQLGANKEILIRRNAVASKWYGSQSRQYGSWDFAGGELLDQPGHQADIWYISVYSRTEPLNAFKLEGKELSPTPFSFDGANFTVSGQAEGTWRFFRIEVPANAVGWNLGVENLVGGRISAYLRKDILPTITYGDFPISDDLTGLYRSNVDGTVPVGELVTSIGDDQKSLPAGTYYLGIYAESGSANSYRVRSRGIGDGFSIPLRTLAFSGAGSSIEIPDLAPREIAVFRVEVPAGARRWKLDLIPTVGDAVMAVSKNAMLRLLNQNYYIYGTQPGAYPGAPLSGALFTKPGSEHMLLLPNYNDDPPIPGTYFVTIASQGTDPGFDQRQIGVNPSTVTLTSQGEGSLINLGSVGAADLTETFARLEVGSARLYQFTVPEGIATIELRLENKLGNPTLSHLDQTNWPYLSDYPYYGVLGGISGERDDNLITLSNPKPGIHSLLVYATGTQNDAAFTLRVKVVPPATLGFDGAIADISNQPQGTWRFFRIEVPANAVGWNLGVENLVGGGVSAYLRKDTLPPSSGGDFRITDDLTGLYRSNVDGTVPVGELVTSIGDDQKSLPAGTYYLGIYAESGSANSYRVRSRGIGDGFSIPLRTLAFSGAGSSIEIPDLAPREIAVFRVEVPAGARRWKLDLIPTVGDAVMAVSKNAMLRLLNQNYYIYGTQPGAYPGAPLSGALFTKPGSEHMLLLPNYNDDPPIPGTYFVTIASQGTDPGFDQRQIGVNPSTVTLTSQGEGSLINLGSVGAADLTETFARLEVGSARLYQFTVPEGIATIELRLENKLGNPTLSHLDQTNWPYLSDYPYYGVLGGISGERDDNLITLSNPKPGIHSLLVYATGTQNDAAFTLRVKTPPIPKLSVAEAFDQPNLGHAASGHLVDNQSAFFEVQIPADANGAPILGWRLDAGTTTGDVLVRVRKGLIPQHDSNTSPIVMNSRTRTGIVPSSALSAGTWFVEVQGVGSTDFTLSSSLLTPDSGFEHVAWEMPTASQTGVTSSLFGDSGEGLTGDQGIDLGRSRMHFYRVNIPNGNAGLFRTELQAISGSPRLFISRDEAPSATGNPERTLGGNVSLYGNWVPFQTVNETQLKPGLYVLGVFADNQVNTRYRLRVSHGTPVVGGLVQAMPWNSGTLSDQLLAGGDWRYYRVTIPADTLPDWKITFSQQVGDVKLFIRDTTPPGDGQYNYQKTGEIYLVDWQRDFKNQGPYPSFDDPGTYTLSNPPLRPGSTYYLGFVAKSDSRFSVSLSSSGTAPTVPGTVAFYGGHTNGTVNPGQSVFLRVPVPTDGVRWKSHGTGDGLIWAYEQGTLARTDSALYRQFDTTDLNISLNSWPWLPGTTFYITATNTTALPVPFTFVMDGRNFNSEDEDLDGLSDGWELQYFGNLYSQTGSGDADGDGISNRDEFLDGTNPTDATSLRPRIQAQAYGSGVISRSPDQASYDLGSTVTLNAVPVPGVTFLRWTGTFTSARNPLVVSARTNVSLTAVFRGPFGGHVHEAPGVIQAEDYDEGGEGIGFHDLSAQPATGAQDYRTAPGATLFPYLTTLDDGSILVTSVETGEWLSYSVHVQQTTNYFVRIHYRNQCCSPQANVRVDGITQGNPIDLPYSPELNTVVSQTFPLAAGNHVVRLEFPAGGAEIDSLSLEVDHPPVFDGFHIATAQDTPITIVIGKLEASAPDPEGTESSVVSADPVSDQGGLIELNSTSIQYTPASGYTGADSFQIQINNGIYSIIGLVTVTVTPGSTGNGDALLGTTVSGNDVNLQFAGIPGRRYLLQRSTSLTPPVQWTTLATIPANESGFVTYTDHNPPSPSFWRTISAP